MSRGPPTSPYSTKVAVTMNEEENAPVSKHEVWSALGVREQNNENVVRQHNKSTVRLRAIFERLLTAR